MTRKHKNHPWEQEFANAVQLSDVKSHWCGKFCDSVPSLSAEPTGWFTLPKALQDLCRHLMLIEFLKKVKAFHNCDTDNEAGKNATLLLQEMYLKPRSFPCHTTTPCTASPLRGSTRVKSMPRVKSMFKWRLEHCWVQARKQVWWCTGRCSGRAGRSLGKPANLTVGFRQQLKKMDHGFKPCYECHGSPAPSTQGLPFDLLSRFRR